MTKEKLEQLIDLRKEIKELEEKIRHEGTAYPSHNIKLLEERKHMAAAAEKEITEYINTVGDSRIRRMMQYRYIEGYTWYKIARIIHYDRTYPEKLISKYLRDNNSTQK